MNLSDRHIIVSYLALLTKVALLLLSSINLISLWFTEWGKEYVFPVTVNIWSRKNELIINYKNDAELSI